MKILKIVRLSVWLSEKEMSRRLNVKNFSHLICQNFKIDVWREIYDTWW